MPSESTGMMLPATAALFAEFRAGHAFDGAFAEALGMSGDPLFQRIGHE